MKLKQTLSVAALLLAVTGSSLSAAVNEDYNSDYTASRKFGRGVANVLTGVIEIPKGVYYENQDSGWVAAYTTGLVDGIVNFVTRECVGVYEIFTFLGNDKEPIVAPEYVLGGPFGVVLDGYNEEFSIDTKPNDHSDHTNHKE